MNEVNLEENFDQAKTSSSESSEQELLAEFEEDFALLIECGFIGAKQLDEMSSNRIFQACQLISPNSVAPQIGMGHIALSKLEVKKATDIFEKVVALEPGNELATCFLGVCFLLSKDKLKKGETLIKEVLEKTTDETVKNLGNLCLEWSKKDLAKKSASPFQI